MNATTDELLTQTAFAARVGISKQRVGQLVSEGKISGAAIVGRRARPWWRRIVG